MQRAVTYRTTISRRALKPTSDSRFCGNPKTCRTGEVGAAVGEPPEGLCFMLRDRLRPAILAPGTRRTRETGPWQKPISWCAPRCSMRPTGHPSTTGMPPTICPSRSGPLRRSAAGAAGAGANPQSIMPSTNSPMPARLIGSEKIRPLVADFDRVWGNRVARRREILEIVQEITP